MIPFPNLLHSLTATFTPQIKSSVQFYTSSFSTHRSYAMSFLFCEVAAFAISVGNLFFTNTFLGGEFFKFGPAALKYLGTNATDPTNPLNEIFPKVMLHILQEILNLLIC